MSFILVETGCGQAAIRAEDVFAVKDTEEDGCVVLYATTMLGDVSERQIRSTQSAASVAEQLNAALEERGERLSATYNHYAESPDKAAFQMMRSLSQ